MAEVGVFGIGIEYRWFLESRVGIGPNNIFNRLSFYCKLCVVAITITIMIRNQTRVKWRGCELTYEISETR